MNTGGPVVFVVDDDRSFLTAVSRLLRAAGHPVESFRSGAELLARLSPDATGCVLADLRMPGMNGIELQEALARSGNPIPVVFLSGHGDVPTTVHALKRGAEDFLTKRASQEDLLERWPARSPAMHASGRLARGASSCAPDSSA